MKRIVSLAAPGLIPLTSGGEGFTGKVTVQLFVVSGTLTLSANFRARVTPPRRALADTADAVTPPALDVNSPLLAYRDTSAAADTAGATAITAGGIFEINVTNMDTVLHVSTLSGGVLGVIIGNSVVS